MKMIHYLLIFIELKFNLYLLIAYHYKLIFFSLNKWVYVKWNFYYFYEENQQKCYFILLQIIL